MIASRSEKNALLGNDVNITYNQLHDEVNKFISLISDVKPGSRICIFSENRPEWVFAFYAIWKQECIVVPVDYLASPDDLQYMIENSTPEAVFCSADREETLSEVLSKASVKPNVLVFEKIDLSKAPINEKQFPANIEEKTALILYTSGTTGNPKGVMLSFKNVIYNILAVSEKVKIIRPEDRLFMLLPVHHIFPLVGTIILPLYLGGTIVMAPSMIPEEFIPVLATYNPTIMIGVPRLYESMHRKIMNQIQKSVVAKGIFGIAKKVNSKQFSRRIFKKVHDRFGGAFMYFIAGGARLEPQIFEDFKVLGFEILEGYGLTETAPMITFNHPGIARGNTPGLPVPGLDVQIIDNEITVKGDNVMKGYYNMPEETDKVIKEGRFYTGDLGHIDDDGFLHITGRKNEMIILPNGKNVNPLELEKKITQLEESVQEVAVFLHENVLQAIIYPDFQRLEQSDFDQVRKHFKTNVIDEVNRHVSRYKRITKLHVIKTELPKTRLGKVKRFELPSLLDGEGNKNQNKVKDPDLEEYRILKRFIIDETGQEVHPQDHLELDLALDSLGKVGLSAYISSTFGVEIKEEDLSSFDSVSKLAEYISENKTRTQEEKLNWSDILKKTEKIRISKQWPTIRILTSFSTLFFNTLYKVKATGKEHIPKPPFILAPNHQSFLDGFLVVSQIPRKYRNEIYSYATVRYFKNRWWRYFATHNNIIVLDIQKNLKNSMQKLADTLKNKRNLMIFPEGTRTRTGELLDFKQSFAILSSELNVPVVPVALKGSYNAYPPDRKLPRLFQNLEVTFMAPVYPSDESYKELTERIFQQIKKEVG